MPPLNRMMDPRELGRSPESQLSRKVRARYNAARFGRADVIDPFFYTTPLTAMAIGATTIATIAVQEDAEFVCEWLSGILARDVAGQLEWTLPTGGMAAAAFAADGAFTAAAVVMITDTGSNRRVMDQPGYWHNIIGTGQKPNYLAAPKHFRPNSTIQVEVRNIGGVAAQWQVVFGGVKLYRIGKT